MNGGILQIFLILNVFIMGGLAVFGLQHAYEHFKPNKAKKGTADTPNPDGLPDETRKKILEQAELAFHTVLERSASDLQKDLVATTGQLNKVLEKVGAEIVESESRLYKENLNDVVSRTNQSVSEAQQNLVKHQAELEQRLAERQSNFEAKLVELQTSLESTLTSRQKEIDQLLDTRRKELEVQLENEMVAQKDHLIAQMDTKLADVVTSFLTEVMQHEVDLGAQEEFLLAQLEEHKDELKKGFSS